MKTIFSFFLAAFCYVGLQSQTVFKDVTAIQFGDSILVDWTLTGGNTCYDMYLKRAEDGITFENIFSVSGVCGGSTDQYYNFIDSEGLKSGTTYSYKITASNGTLESETVHIQYINAGDVQIFVYPNPTTSDINITIDNKYTPRFLVEFYGADGQLISKSMQYENLFTLNTDQMSANPYLIKITTEDGIVFGQKIIVQ
ncbi:MAG: T9SS type A sorting domain-containing protein [Chitinophagales bacterium]|jgi:hypothetical protein|nr:T9SS type A sorting domain-containing protein [Bacteroidota bacterium]MBK7569608.1 T9SS type A sorting domain-containing protein [Bacteroidota bacterium]MBP8916666.1 T9SS type A sorting domain-containing protein [Chitinophagales bacterium]MBP9220479.1 T9SS type A sorting domain-containing protein [Chitinophagales bacterium]MBP9796014.1 T9SS type A sorting domain-containing protein [Chitinophagales bacterium]